MSPKPWIPCLRLEMYIKVKTHHAYTMFIKCQQHLSKSVKHETRQRSLKEISGEVPEEPSVLELPFLWVMGEGECG